MCLYSCQARAKPAGRAGRLPANRDARPPRGRYRAYITAGSRSTGTPHAGSAVTRGRRGLAAPSAAATDVVVLCCSAATSPLLHVAYKPLTGRLHSRGEDVLYGCDASRREMAEAQLKLAPMTGRAPGRSSGRPASSEAAANAVI